MNSGNNDMNTASPTPSPTKAVFLDRDGVINEDPGYLHRVEDVRFVPGIFDFCADMRRLGYLLVVITNQSGVARGYFTLEDVRRVNDRIRDEFAARGIDIADFFVCPFHPEGTVKRYARASSHRKPAPGMVLNAARKWHIDLSRSFAVGDKSSDRIELNDLRSYVVKSRYVPEDYDFESLHELRRFILDNTSELH